MVDRGTINIRRLLSRCVMMTDNQLTVVDAKRLLRFSSVIKEQVETVCLVTTGVLLRMSDAVHHNLRLKKLRGVLVIKAVLSKCSIAFTVLS